ncbi:MAG TPA: hypothetical protein DCX07_12945, partial [Phycisphaerales bacterium]|nr:hypothetical protein [Phycisphaerales bacterium]
MTNVAKAFPCLVCLWAFCAAAPADEPVATVVLADFEKGRDGFEASLVRDPAVAKNGQASGRIDADFTNAKAEPWKIVGAPLLYTNEIRAVRFWVRSHDAGGLTFRVIDSSGQVHQLRPKFQPNGEWQQVVLDSFEKGPGYQSWGGAKDRRFHWPARRLAIIFEKNNLPEGKVAGSLWIDQVELDLAGKPATVLDGCETVVLEDFEAPFKQRKMEDRLSGLAQDAKEFKGGAASGRFEGDFTREGGQPWRPAGRSLEVVREFRRIRFWVRSADVKAFTFILTDKTGQAHHQSVPIEPDGEWQQVAIDAFDTGPGYRHYGGANDGRFHWPAKGIGFVIGKGDAAGPVTRTLWIDDIEALAEPGPFVPDLEMEQDQLGNVFLTTETVRIPLVSKGDRIEWTVRDFWHRQVERGVAVVRDTRAVIEPQAGRKGYFEVRLVIRKGDLTLAETDTSFAVITPVDIATMKDSPFGVMTHFAQGWDLDIMPLIAKAGITSIRDEQYWQQIEKNKDEFVFTSKFTDWMAEAAKFHIDPLVPMTFANKNYDEGLTPHTPEGCKAYGRYGQELLKKYGRQIQWLEIWNEYNGTWCKGPAADDRPKYYAQMLKYSYEAIKEIRPDVQVLGGAAVLLPRPYFEGIFKHGGMKYMDGVVIHPYRAAPEGVEEEIRELKDLMRKYNDGKTKPIWVTETGTHDKTPHGRYNVARYLVRMYTLLLSEECEKIYWYLLRDYSSFKTMGLLRDPNDPMGRYAVAPPYPAYANLIRQLSGAKFVRREPTDPRTRVYRFDKGGEPVRVCWATVPAHFALAADAPLTVTDLMGQEQRLEPVEGKVYLTLTDNAVYVKGATKEILPAGGRFVLAAEQAADILGDVTLKFSVDNRGGAQALEGVFEAHGQKANIACPAGAAQDLSLTIPGEDTKTVDTREYAYRLTLNGKAAGLGQVTVHVVDPLTFSPDAKIDASRGMELRLGNASPRTAYEVESVSWKVADAPQTVQATAIQLPASKDLRFGLPLADLPDYRTAKVSASVKLKGRDAMLFSDEASCNPCYRRTVRADGDLGDWDHAPAIDLAADGEVWPPVAPAAA